MNRAMFTILLVIVSGAFAQVNIRGEVEFAADATLSEAFPTQPGWTVAGRLEADTTLAPFDLTLVLEPSVRFSAAGDVTFEPGLTEAYAFTTLDTLDLSVGVARLPLETARLSVPYSVETVGARGFRRGVPGVRVDAYPGDWRVRGALFYQATTESVTPLLSVRRGFGAFELEAHALYLGELVIGLGGSGLLGDLVLYGEAWLLTEPLEPRAALGLSGNLERGNWTLEVAYLALTEASLNPDPDAEATTQQTLLAGPQPALLGQLAYPLDEFGEQNLTLLGSAFLTDTVQGRLTAGYSRLEGEREFRFTVGSLFGSEGAVFTVALAVRGFF